MPSFLVRLVSKAKRRFHMIMRSYNYILYRDCLDQKMKRAYYEKVTFHQSKADDMGLKK